MALSDIPQRVRDFVLERDGRRCVSCGRGGDNRLQVHHITFRSQGGDHSPENLATLCAYGEGNCHPLVHAGRLRVYRLEWRPGQFAFFCRRRPPRF